MGGRGASSGLSDKGRPYGSEFHSLLKVGNIKFIKSNDAENAKDPLETMTKGRIYAVLNADNEVSSINYYGEDGKRVKSINLLHEHNGMKPHVHMGYYHDEGGTRNLTNKERKMVDFVIKVWENKKSR